MKFYNCSCFIKSNIFIKRLKSHFVYESDEQFLLDYKEILSSMKDNDEIHEILEEVKTEVKRRKGIEEESAKRKDIIKHSYKRLHSDIYELQESYLESDAIKLAEACVEGKNLSDLSYMDILSKEKKIYGFNLFTKEFCKKMIEELDYFQASSLPKGRPNSMNRYGVLLDELGFTENFLDQLRLQYINPIAKCIFSEYCGQCLDSHRAFTVRYKAEEDIDLDEHFDNAEVTINVCLGKEFTGSDLYFGDMKYSLVNLLQYLAFPHKVGYAILHRGQHLHGTLPITDGERVNMIIWLRSSSVRNKLCPMCNSTPNLMSANGYGDGFTASPSKQNM